jgi:protein-tyrosine-phosphatase
MAEGFANKFLQSNGNTSCVVISRALTGAYEPPNSHASRHGIEVLLEHFSIDISSHRSALLTQQEVDNADFIIGVSKSHHDLIESMFERSSTKTFHLKKDVPDPWHSDKTIYLQCAEMMQPLVHDILQSLIPKMIDMKKDFYN